MNSQPPRLEIISLKAACAWRMPNSNDRVFLKVAASGRPRARQRIWARYRAERVALEVLQGLAVPRPMHLDYAELARAVGALALLDKTSRALPWIAESYEGRAFHEHEVLTDPAFLLGAWLFCAEQVVAFRRHQLLYTDLKCNNIVARRRPLRVIIVDFDRVVPLAGNKKQAWAHFGYTPGFEPPEVRTSARPTEAACVFQLGILLAHFLAGTTTSRLLDPRHGILRASSVLDRMGAGNVGELVRACMAQKAGERPQTYERVFEEATRRRLPDSVLRTWRALRRPYATRLAEVDLEGPESGDRP